MDRETTERRRPKPLLRVFKNSDQTWSYQCDRCGRGRWTDVWEHTLSDGVEHLDVHTKVGFR